MGDNNRMGDGESREAAANKYTFGDNLRASARLRRLAEMYEAESWELLRRSGINGGVGHAGELHPRDIGLAGALESDGELGHGDAIGVADVIGKPDIERDSSDGLAQALRDRVVIGSADSPSVNEDNNHVAPRVAAGSCVRCRVFIEVADQNALVY